MRADDTPSGVYLLTKGYVRCYSISKTGQDFTLIIHKPNDFFPMAWAINNSSNRYYYESMTSVVVQRVKRDDFTAFLKTNPDIFLFFTSHILSRMEGLFRRMKDLVFGGSYNKVASILLICAQRFGIRDGKSIIVLLPLTHQDLASLLGVARETVSVEINRLKKINIVSYRGRLLVILSVRKLQKASKV